MESLENFNIYNRKIQVTKEIKKLKLRKKKSKAQLLKVYDDKTKTVFTV